MQGQVSAALNLSSVLWRTRGFDWDYGFLLEPASPRSVGWYRVQQAIFEGRTPTTKTTYVIGALLERSNAKTPFVGATFLDPSRKDEYGRQIAHYVVWLRKGIKSSNLLDSTPIGWERAFLSHLSAAFGSTDVLVSPESNQTGEKSPTAYEALKKKLRHIDRTVVVTGSALPASLCINVGDITRAQAGLPDERPGKEPNVRARNEKSGRVTDSKSLAANISSAINAGEAWALTHDSSFIQKYLPSLRVGRELISSSRDVEKDRELASRILKSFSGSADDGFIKARLRGTRGRYIRTRADTEPSKGFDGIVTCLRDAGFQEVVFNLDEQDACKRLASTIGHGASGEDRFIRNILMRLRSA